MSEQSSGPKFHKTQARACLLGPFFCCLSSRREDSKDLEAKGLEVLLDDRREASAGVKFKDAELIGVPKIIIVGKSLADGKVEIRDRKSSDKVEVALADVVKTLVK